MKLTRKLLASSIAAAAITASTFVPSANAEGELSASMAIASSYHWRGLDLGSGTPAVSGSLDYSIAGFYTGMWVSSGDTTGGTEYDLYVGYAGSLGDFSYDISYVTYVYPTQTLIGFEEPISETDGTPGDFAEVILRLGFGPVSAFYHDNVAGETGGYAFDEDYRYFGASVSVDAFSATIAKHDTDQVANFVHLDLGYSYNDNLSFLLSVPVDSDEGYFEPEPKFVASYSFDIK